MAKDYCKGSLVSGKQFGTAKIGDLYIGSINGSIGGFSGRHLTGSLMVPETAKGKVQDAAKGFDISDMDDVNTCMGQDFWAETASSNLKKKDYKLETGEDSSYSLSIDLKQVVVWQQGGMLNFAAQSATGTAGPNKESFLQVSPDSDGISANDGFFANFNFS